MVSMLLTWMYGTCMPVLNIQTWPRGDIPGLGLTNEDVSLLRGLDCDIEWLKA
jgi:hypothetical protein